MAHTVGDTFKDNRRARDQPMIKVANIVAHLIIR